MRARRKRHMFLMFLAGVLISVMLVLMRLGGSVNVQEFMSAGRVYDFEPLKLQKNSSGWMYDREKEGHWLLREKASIRFQAGKKIRRWGFLYINVRQMSTESMTGVLRYYGKENTKILEQPITLTQGRNVITMDRTIPIRKIGIVLLDAQGEFISISDMQIRTKPSWFTVSHFLELFAVALAASLVLLAILNVCFRIIGAKISANRGKTEGFYWLIDGMQDIIRTFGDFLGSRVGGRLYPHQREGVRKFLFSVLLVWMMVGNVAGWAEDIEICRYYVLVCAFLLLTISFVSWERALQNQSWRGALMKSWLAIWIGMMLCDFFIERQLESVTGCAMLLAGSVFVYFWQNMENPERMLRNLMESLEITFFLGIIYCMIFRMKRPAVDYNGMFKSPEELAMYGVFMGIVFLTELDWLMNDRIAAYSGANITDSKKGVFASCVKNITGGAIALFLVLRSNHMLGIAIFILLGICYIPGLIVKIYEAVRKCRILFIDILAAAIVAYVCVCLVFISTKYFPGILGMDMEYENELLVTELNYEERELYLAQYPGSLDNVRVKDVKKLPIIWRAYGRRLNLFGHSGNRRIFRRQILPYNGCLEMAYRHGIFILLPYVAFQISVIALGIRCVFRKRGRRNFFMLFLGIAYLCFSFGSNVEISWGHPLWLCYYLSAGYLGKMERRKT